MGGGAVDLGDQQIYEHMKEARCYNWYKKLFSNLFYCALLNTHILYSKQHSSPKTFLEFMPQVGSDLLEGRKQAATRGNNQMHEEITELFSCPRKERQM